MRNLSGGNQQKVVLAKWLIGDAQRRTSSTSRRAAIDVGAKAEIYALMLELLQARRGDRDGLERAARGARDVAPHPRRARRGDRAEFSRADATPAKVIAAATGVAA